MPQVTRQVVKPKSSNGKGTKGTSVLDRIIPANEFEDHGVKMVVYGKGKPGFFNGKTHSEESRMKMSKSHSGKVLSEEHKKRIGASVRKHNKRSQKESRSA